jgi:arylsulfatase
VTIDPEFGGNAPGVLCALRGSGGGLALVCEYDLMIVERCIARSANKLPAGEHRKQTRCRSGARAAGVAFCRSGRPVAGWRPARSPVN